jgi:ATP-dependent protease ClpP protease subunit
MPPTVKKVLRTRDVILSSDLYPEDLECALDSIREIESLTDKPINLKIRSRGGVVCKELFALIDHIKKSKHQFIAVAEENIASAAALIFLVCDSRIIRRDKKILLHAVEMKIPFYKIRRCGCLPTSIYDEFQKHQKKIEDIISRHTELSGREVGHFMKEDGALFDSDGAKTRGLVDGIVA